MGVHRFQLHQLKAFQHSHCASIKFSYSKYAGGYLHLNLHLNGLAALICYAVVPHVYSDKLYMVLKYCFNKYVFELSTPTFNLP